jgi:hypothetical protein
MAHHAQSALLDATYQPHRPSDPHPAHLQPFRMKEAHRLQKHILFDETFACRIELPAAA